MDHTFGRMESTGIVCQPLFYDIVPVLPAMFLFFSSMNPFSFFNTQLKCSHVSRKKYQFLSVVTLCLFLSAPHNLLVIPLTRNTMQSALAVVIWNSLDYDSL